MGALSRRFKHMFAITRLGQGLVHHVEAGSFVSPKGQMQYIRQTQNKTKSFVGRPVLSSIEPLPKSDSTLPLNVLVASPCNASAMQTTREAAR